MSGLGIYLRYFVFFSLSSPHRKYIFFRLFWSSYLPIEICHEKNNRIFSLSHAPIICPYSIDLSTLNYIYNKNNPSNFHFLSIFVHLFNPPTRCNVKYLCRSQVYFPSLLILQIMKMNLKLF